VVAENYETVRNQMRLIELIMAVSVLLSLLGLVAMSTHFASEREKSIAIRKVFGGTLQSETRRSLMEYLVLMLIANAIAIPIAIYVCGKYLERFAYRINLSPWIFILAVVLSLLIAFLSVLWQTLRAAKTNPASALKNS
jgi:putative ABC transport system permease protein